MIGAAATIVGVCELGSSTDALASFVTAGFVPLDGKLDIWQQEPSPEGASEICVSECCRPCIIGQSSPPQWPAIPDWHLASAASGIANSTSASMAAASLTDRFTSSLLFYVAALWAAVTPITSSKDEQHTLFRKPSCRRSRTFGHDEQQEPSWHLAGQKSTHVAKVEAH